VEPSWAGELRSRRQSFRGPDAPPRHTAHAGRTGRASCPTRRQLRAHRSSGLLRGGRGTFGPGTGGVVAADGQRCLGSYSPVARGPGGELDSVGRVGALWSRHLASEGVGALVLRAAIRLYDLRHTCATLLLCRNVHPKYVQELLGHASIAQTLDTYSHVLPGMNGGIGDTIDEILR
jgi:hypothetical protein